MNNKREYLPEESITNLYCFDEEEFIEFARQYELPFDRFSECKTGWEGIKATADGGIWVYYYGGNKMYFYAE